MSESSVYGLIGLFFIMIVFSFYVGLVEEPAWSFTRDSCDLVDEYEEDSMKVNNVDYISDKRWYGDYSQIVIETEEGTYIYDKYKVKHIKSEEKGLQYITKTYGEWCEQIIVQVGPDMVNEIQDDYVRKYKQNLDWEEE